MLYFYLSQWSARDVEVYKCFGKLNHFNTHPRGFVKMSSDTHCAIFVCQKKLSEHDAQYRKFYNDHSSPALVRQALAKLTSTIADSSENKVTYIDDSFKETYNLVAKNGLLVTTQLTSAKPTCIKTYSIRNPSTFHHFNKLCSFIDAALDEVQASALVSYLNTLINLTHKGYVFDCHVEPTYMTLNMESTRTKLNVDVTIEIV